MRIRLFTGIAVLGLLAACTGTPATNAGETGEPTEITAPDSPGDTTDPTGSTSSDITVDPSDTNVTASGPDTPSSPDPTTPSDTPAEPVTPPQRPDFPTQVISPPVATGPVVPLQPGDVLNQPAGMMVLVTGNVIVPADPAFPAQLCDVVAESWPPQCAGTVINVWDFDPTQFGMTDADGVLFGELTFLGWTTGDADLFFADI